MDAGERPDLLARIREGALHNVTCPHCGRQEEADAPLLLLRPGVASPLLFSPAQQTTAEQDREQAIELLNMLRERMGADWRDEWLAQGLPAVPRPFLPAALSDDPEAALRQMAERAQQEIERLLAYRLYEPLPGEGGDIPAGTPMVCPVDPRHYRRRLQFQGQRLWCPEHKVALVPEEGIGG